MVALILADGDAPARSVLDAAWPGWDESVDLVIAADGGARHASTLGVVIDVWVGDGDSIGEAALASLAAAGVPIERSRPDKDESDTELAMAAALRLGATGIVIVGALGGPR
ncbi:MAG TPA: thiamine diphosphokinase, partial [Candidatus Limnocylindrales bacterium]|nr:thiamine diphosphokinase [Candidatus Limnocylindrales bacterium]